MKKNTISFNGVCAIQLLMGLSCKVSLHYQIYLNAVKTAWRWMVNSVFFLLNIVHTQIMTVASWHIMIFRPIRAGPGSGNRQPGGWLLSCHSDTAAGVACLPSPGNLAAPLGSSTKSLLWLSAPRRWLDPTVTKEQPLPITLITSPPK